MFQKMLPRTYGHKAFYIRVRPNLCFRVYMVKHLFSSVGGAWIIEFYVSYRDLRKLRTFPFQNAHKSFGLDCSPEEGNRILNSLKKKGCVNLEKHFRLDS